MTCLSGALTDPVFQFCAAIVGLAALVLIWTVRTQEFGGKIFYSFTLLGVIWALITVGLEAAADDFSCQLRWASVAWLGHATVPVAWCFFVSSYVGDQRGSVQRRGRLALAIIPPVALGVALTNPWHNLLYTGATEIPVGGDRIEYVHGSGFYTVIAVLYVFVLATFLRLASAFSAARRDAWPVLIMLTLISATPALSNIAYVGFGFTVYNLDPTPLMFTFGVLAFTWMLVSGRTIDMAAAGRSVLFDTMSEPVVLVDRQQKVVLANAAAKRSGLVGSAGDLLKDTLENADKTSVSGTLPHVNLGERVFEPRVQKIESPLNPSGDSLGYSVTFVDITERIAMHAALETALQQADAANRSKDDFIATMSHEMRTPLTSLKGGLTLALSGRAGDIDDRMRSLLELAQRNGVRLSSFVENILMAQKLDAGALALDAEPVDLGRILEDSIKENRMFAASRGIRMVIGQIDRPAIVAGDAFALRQITDNLISNAIKFSKEKGFIEGSVETIDGRVRLSVKDTGPGIPEGMEDRVFGRFSQIEASGKGSAQGSGLGLHISKQLALQMTGRIHYESQVGSGTTFHAEFELTQNAGTAATSMAG